MDREVSEVGIHDVNKYLKPLYYTNRCNDYHTQLQKLHTLTLFELHTSINNKVGHNASIDAKASAIVLYSSLKWYQDAFRRANANSSSIWDEKF